MALALGAGLEALNEHYNSTRGTLNAEVIKYSSMILILVGLAKITFSVIKSYKH